MSNKNLSRIVFHTQRACFYHKHSNFVYSLENFIIKSCTFLEWKLFTSLISKILKFRILEMKKHLAFEQNALFSSNKLNGLSHTFSLVNLDGLRTFYKLNRALHKVPWRDEFFLKILSFLATLRILKFLSTQEKSGMRIWCE